MEISPKLLKFKPHVFFALAALSLSAFLLIYVGPRFVHVIAYFWPLLLSTALFLVAVFVFGRTSAPPGTGSHGEKAGEGLLDFVAGRPDELVHLGGTNSTSAAAEDMM